MEALDDILTMLDEVLSDKNRRHVLGGVLMSVSLLFGRPSCYCNNNENGGQKILWEIT